MNRATRPPRILREAVRSRASASTDEVPVQPVIVGLSALLVPILLAAFVLLYVRPHDLGAEYFAWSISPLMSSMMLGATYLGGAYFFVVVVLTRRWRYVRLGFLPVSAFAGTLAVTTLLHWDRFAHDRFGFTLWAALYFVVPVVLPLLWYRNQRLATGAALDRDGELPTSIRRAFGALGLVLVGAGALLLVVPEQMIAVWPWTVSPLTARTMSAIYLLPGLVGMSLADDGSWSGARYLLQSMAVTIVLMLVAAAVARADFAWSNPSSWTFVGGLLSVLVLIAYTYRTASSDETGSDVE